MQVFPVVHLSLPIRVGRNFGMIQRNSSTWTKIKLDIFLLGDKKLHNIYSVDPDNSTTFGVDHVFLKADKYLVENIKIDDTNRHGLPESGATIFIMSIPIENGSEAPARIIAYA